MLRSRVGCPPSWGGLCASFAQWLLPLCSLSHVCCSGSFAVLFTVRDCRLVCDLLGGICFSPLPFFLSYFLVNIFLMFMFRWKAIVDGLWNSCCR